MVIILNGSINAGKTTTAKALAKLLPHTAHLEVDSLRVFVEECMTLKESIPLLLECTAKITRSMRQHGLNIIISYPFSKKNYDFLLEQLGEIHSPIYFVTLRPPLEAAITNRGTRQLDDDEIARIKYHYEIGLNNHDFGLTIDNSQLTPEQTAQTIVDWIKNEE